MNKRQLFVAIISDLYYRLLSILCYMFHYIFRHLFRISIRAVYFSLLYCFTVKSTSFEQFRKMIRHDFKVFVLAAYIIWAFSFFPVTLDHRTL